VRQQRRRQEYLQGSSRPRGEAGNGGGVGPETNEGEGSGGGDKNLEDTTSTQAGDDGGVGPEPNEGEGSGGGDENPDMQVEKLWKRRDAAKWTVELTRVHAAFECGKTWGRIEWALLVDRFFDFEAAWGFVDVGGQITTEDRPNVLDCWISRGRKWEKNVDIGVLGDAKTPRMFVSKWWSWWVKVQPKDRSDWAPMLKLHGKNGMLQIMVLLLWWGKRVADGSPADAREWLSAVEDVAETFRGMLHPGVIAKL
jgi:hypothetical protein